MSTTTRPAPATTDRSGEMLFLAMVIIGYVVAFSYPPRPYTPAEVILLLAAGVIYTVVGTWGSTVCERRRSPRLIALFFVSEIILGTAIYHVTGGQAWLILLPIAGIALELLPRRWPVVAVLVGLLPLSLIYLFPHMYYDESAEVFEQLTGLERWRLVAGTALQYGSAIAFVVIFARALVREREARAQVERLAAELGQAYSQLRQYAAQAEELAIVKERNRLAREIHDGLGHFLTAINMQIEAARAVMESDRPRSLNALSKAQTLAQDGLSEVRRSVAALRTSPIEGRALADAIAQLVEESRAAGIATELDLRGEPRALAPQVELALYRAAQEGLTNVRKHAQAASAEVALDYGGEDAVRLTIRDSGIGTDDPGGGFGLLGVRERFQLLGGQVSVRSAPGEGFVLEIEVPV